MIRNELTFSLFKMHWKLALASRIKSLATENHPNPQNNSFLKGKLEEVRMNNEHSSISKTSPAKLLLKQKFGILHILILAIWVNLEPSKILCLLLLFKLPLLLLLLLLLFSNSEIETSAFS